MVDMATTTVATATMDSGVDMAAKVATLDTIMIR